MGNQLVNTNGNGNATTNGNGNGNGHKELPSLGNYDKAALPDIHAVQDTRGIAINRVGIDGVAFPMSVGRKDGSEEVQTLGKFDMYGSLDGSLKGTNMSRFAELLLDHGAGEPLSGLQFPALLRSLASRLETDDVYVRASFKFWMNKTSPVSKRVSPMSYDCAFIGQLYGDKLKFIVETSVPIATYCPCSKAMCLTNEEAGVGKGAHAQRGIVTTQTIMDPPSPGMWLEDQIRMAELSGSAELYTLLKRPDEKFVTIQGYDNPKFVEDVAREVVARTQEVEGVTWVKVRARNYESIHDHNATAYVSQKKVDGVWVNEGRAFY